MGIPTSAFAFLYASVHADAKSGTCAGLPTGGGFLGEVSGYTPGMGGCEDGEGKGKNGYGIVGMTDGPDCVSTLMLVVVVVSGAEEVGEEVDEDEVRVLDWDELVWEWGESDEGVVRDK
jgi:hypothetical protein